MEQLLHEIDCIFDSCFQLFQAKNSDYGPTWLLYRLPSLNDEIWRKAKRIRTLEEHDGRARVPEGREAEYVGIINYSIMFLIKLDPPAGIPASGDLTENVSALDHMRDEDIFAAYQACAAKAKELLIQKNTDYADAWRSMALCSMTDQVVIRAYRIRKILSNGGKCTVSEGIDAQLYDIINYCVFALIKMGTETDAPERIITQ